MTQQEQRGYRPSWRTGTPEVTSTVWDLRGAGPVGLAWRSFNAISVGRTKAAPAYRTHCEVDARHVKRR